MMDMMDPEGPLLIAQVDIPGSIEHAGDYYYRTYAPGVSMARQPGVHVVNCSNENRLRDVIFRAADVLVLNLICDPDLLPLIRYRQRAGKLTVFELNDDIFNLPPCNPRYGFYNSENVHVVEMLARSCDAMQFSSDVLRGRYGHWNPASITFPNHILNAPGPRRHARKDHVAVGWGGSAGHLEDMREIASSLTAWILTREDVGLHLMCADSIWELFSAVPEHRKRKFETGSISDYYRFLRTLDIGMAPLEDNAYNQGRSDIKFVEYAAHGVAPVVQAVGPYVRSVEDGVTGFLFENISRMISILDMLCDDMHTRVRVSVAARDYVMSERLFLNRGGERLEFYRKGLAGLLHTHGRAHDAHDGRSRDAHGWRSYNAHGGRSGEDGGPGRTAGAGVAVSAEAAARPAVSEDRGGAHAPDVFRRLCDAEGARSEGRHLLLLPTAFELALRDALYVMQQPESVSIREDHATVASRLYESAAALEPANYLPHLYGAYCSGNTVRSLGRAVQLNPDSIRAWDLLGLEFLRLGQPENASRCFSMASNLFPEYRPSWRRDR